MQMQERRRPQVGEQWRLRIRPEEQCVQCGHVFGTSKDITTFNLNVVTVLMIDPDEGLCEVCHYPYEAGMGWAILDIESSYNPGLYKGVPITWLEPLDYVPPQVGRLQL